MPKAIQNIFFTLCPSTHATSRFCDVALRPLPMFVLFRNRCNTYIARTAIANEMSLGMEIMILSAIHIDLPVYTVVAVIAFDPKIMVVTFQRIIPRPAVERSTLVGSRGRILAQQFSENKFLKKIPDDKE